MEQLFVSESLKETQEIAGKLISKLGQGTTICLFGELASGKTTFAQGLGTALGISRMVSPTYLIMREYPVSGHPVIKRFYHLDLYRLETVSEIKAFEIDEIWSDPTNLLVIEWPEKFLKILPKPRTDIYFKATGDNQRELKITTHK